jgi:hypothetical protein
MIDVSNFGYGWLDLQLKNKTFRVSYLTDVKSELDKLFNLSNGELDVKRSYFDGEWRGLYLTAWKAYNTLFITWEEEGEDVDVLKFDFNEFIKHYNNIWKDIEKDYYNLFLFKID